MASCCCSPVTWIGTCNDAFYFQVVSADTGVDEDSFGISKRCLNYWVRSKDNKFLLLNSEQQFQVQNLTSELLCQPDCKVKIQIYNNLDMHYVKNEGKNMVACRGETDAIKRGREGMAVMLYVENEGKKIVVCGGETDNIYPEKMETLPEEIKGSNHKALFYMTKLSPANTFWFESSMYPSMYLGFEPDGFNPSLNKLVMHNKAQDEVDESCQLILLKNI
ncbi:uncharacterized protein LOC129093342 [Anoplopoma fimbria]|uniref:uncharacterized protein LOC129093342 n=1 Tax=Anoplopoma fimbria TaxID=229290 RepID=UPI0023EBC75F|nr:uncharacterized protein LOC129093342 [Anoplopoma fimbria]XP_054457329.1 uncharacterized protein LOC129093342 [Anoplopoma fimbria]